MDYESFQTCFRVNRAWNELLSSQHYQKITAKMLIEKEKNEKKLWDMSDLGKTNEVKKLVSAGGWMNVNCVAGRKQSTPLYQAAWHGYTDVVKVLLDGGAEPDKPNCAGYTPLHVVAFSFSNKGRTDVVKLLLDGGAQPNKENHNNGMTPLSIAAEFGHKEMIQLLLERGADPYKTDRWGRTPLHFALRWGHKEVEELLRQYANHNYPPGACCIKCYENS